MSVRVMSLVFECDMPNLKTGRTRKENGKPEIVSKSAAKSVLLALANHAHDDGTNAFPGTRLLARETSMSGATVERALQALRHNDYIRKVGKSVRETNDYTLNYDLIAANRYPKERKGHITGRAGDTSLGEQDTSLGEQGTHHWESETVSNHQVTIKENHHPVSVSQNAKPGSKEIRDAYTEFTGQTPLWNNKAYKQYLDTLIELGATREQIETAVETWNSDEQYNWKGKRMITPKLLCEYWTLLTEARAEKYAGLITGVDDENPVNLTDEETTPDEQSVTEVSTAVDKQVSTAEVVSQSEDISGLQTIQKRLKELSRVRVVPGFIPPAEWKDLPHNADKRTDFWVSAEEYKLQQIEFQYGIASRHGVDRARRLLPVGILPEVIELLEVRNG